MNSFLNALYSEGQAFSLLELIGVITSLIYVGLAAKGNRWCFLFGLFSSLIYVYLATTLKFYFDSVINAYYVIMSFYGWFAWGESAESNTSTSLSVQKPKAKSEKLIVESLDNKIIIWWIVAGVLVTLLLAFYADRFSDAALPYLDAFTTVFAILATWWTVKKYLENWLVWIAVDCVASGMYFYKELYLTSILFGIYTVIAVFGYLKWKKELV